ITAFTVTRSLNRCLPSSFGWGPRCREFLTTVCRAQQKTLDPNRDLPAHAGAVVSTGAVAAKSDSSAVIAVAVQAVLISSTYRLDLTGHDRVAFRHLRSMIVYGR